MYILVDLATLLVRYNAIKMDTAIIVVITYMAWASCAFAEKTALRKKKIFKYIYLSF